MGKEKGSEINIFKILKMESGSENRHSNFLAWLLNPKENHNLKTDFIKRFFNSLEISEYNDEILENVSIVREDIFDNGRSDIVIKNGDKAICVIEVKFGAKETGKQCKNYFENYGDIEYIFLDIDYKNYEKLKIKYKNNKFKFEETYKLATFRDNILKILEDILISLNNETKQKQCINEETKQILEQYTNLLKEKYYIFDECKIVTCLKNIINKEEFKKYKAISGSIEHDFIWHATPERYNWALNKIIREKNKILLQWKEDGSFSSFRFAEEKGNYKQMPHFYLNHHKGFEIELRYVEQFGNPESINEIIVSKDNYFKNMTKSDEDFYKQLREALNKAKLKILK